MSVDLPIELVRKILLHAAQSSTSSCRTLCKVSAWVRHLALPHLYTSVLASTIETIVSLRPVCLPDPRFKLVGTVRNIWALLDNAKWVDIMHHCTGLSHLASIYENLVMLAEDEECFNNPGHLTNDLHILMLSNPGWENDGVGWALHESSDNDNLHFFRRITHLRLEGPAGLEVGMHLDHMDRLTHLAIPFPDTGEDLELVLEEHLKGVLDVLERTSVEVFVIVLSLEVQPEDQCQDIEKWVCEVRNKGASGVYVVRTVYDDLEEEWDAEVKGGVTMWKRAVEYTRLLVGRTHPRIDLTTPVDLPHEILHSIFLYAAESSTSFCRALSEVSVWVRHLVLPLLYHTITITNATRLNAFARLISAPLTCLPSPTFRPADAVRHLWVPFASETLRSVVRQCDNVTHLAIHHHDLIRLPDVTIPGSPEHHGHTSARAHAGTGDLHVFVFDIQVIEHSELPSYNSISARALFSRITHLRLGGPLSAYAEVPVNHMSRVTHLAVPYLHDHEQELDDMISDAILSTNVEMLVVVFARGDVSQMERRTIEGWIGDFTKDSEGGTELYAVVQLYSEPKMEWEAEVRGETTIWERAAIHTRSLITRAGRRRYSLQQTMSYLEADI